MKKKIILLLMTAVISCSLLGCGEEYIIDVDTETDVMAVDTTTGKPSLHQELDVKDEDFKLVCDYDTGGCNAKSVSNSFCKSAGNFFIIFNVLSVIIYILFFYIII